MLLYLVCDGPPVEASSNVVLDRICEKVGLPIERPPKLDFGLSGNGCSAACSSVGFRLEYPEVDMLYFVRLFEKIVDKVISINEVFCFECFLGSWFLVLLRYCLTDSWLE